MKARELLVLVRLMVVRVFAPDFDAQALKNKNNVLTLEAPDMKVIEFANSIDPDEVAHHEPPHLDLLCLPSRL